MSLFLKYPIAENILLLQGPVGYFFSDLRKYLLKNGAKKVTKINFNAGDDFFYKHPNVIRYNQPFHKLQSFYNKLLDTNQIDAVYLFGDCRFIHRSAIDVFKSRNIPYYVFEEGYIRPNYITLERGGVNGNSSLKFTSIGQVPEVKSENLAKEQHKQMTGYGAFRTMVFWGFIYFSLCRLLQSKYPFYIHHKSVSPLEIIYWLRSFVRKYYYKMTNFHLQKSILLNYPKKYFFVPLQVYNDAQIFSHSPFHDVTDFIETVMGSFSKNAPMDQYLVFKHHPLDRGHRHYKKFIKQRAKQLGIKKRVFYLHEVSLPQMLKNAKGVVTINSTLGLSALYHQAPVKVLGSAFYDIGGLTYQGSLDRFWQQPGKVINSNFLKYKKYIIEKSQIIGSFYRKIF